MPKLNPNARLVVVVFLIAFCLMMRFGDHNLYLVDERTEQVKLKHSATTSEKIIPSVLIAGLSVVVALGLDKLLNGRNT